mgnify:CR=1 FL=1
MAAWMAYSSVLMMAAQMGVELVDLREYWMAVCLEALVEPLLALKKADSTAVLMAQ